MDASPGRDAATPPSTWHALGTAIEWFTRLPVGRGAPGGAPSAAALVWLPVVGVVVAGVGAAIRAATLPLLGDWPSAVLTVAATVAVTGAYHEDGLADTTDGLWGGRDRGRRLEIMRDSRLGTYGAAALALSLLLRVTLLAPLTVPDTARALVVGHVVGRATTLPLVRLVPAARPDGQLAAVLPAVPGPVGWGVWLAVGAGAVVAATGVWAPVVVAVGAAAATPVVVAARRRIGGLTGDVLGAANQAAHLGALAAAVALLGG